MQQSSSLQVSGTPFSRGIGTQYDPKTGSTRPLQEQYIMADLKEQLVAPLGTLLQVIYDKKKYWLDSADTKARHERIREDDTFKNLMEVYKAPVKDEEDRYDPFCQLSNRAISLLLPDIRELPLVICRNDRVKILGSSAIRYPDCVGVSNSALKDSRRESPAKLAKEGPKELPFGWHEVLTFFEFKMTEQYLGKKLEPELNILANTSDQSGTKKSQPAGFNLMEADVILPAENNSSRGAAGNSAKRRPGDSSISPQDQRKKLRSQPQISKESSPEPVYGDQFSNTFQSENNDNEDSHPGDQDDRDLDYHPGLIVEKPKQEEQTKEEQTQKDSKTRVDYAIQCASYGLEMLSHSAPATHRVGFLVNDDKIQFQYYDRTRCVVSPEVSFVENPSILIEILDCLASASRKEWGFLEAINPPQEALPTTTKTANSLYLSSSTLSCNNGATLRLGEILFRHHAIVGRGTCVVSAESTFPDWEGKSLIVKITFTPATRFPEGSYLSKMLKHAEETGDDWVRDHLPEKLHFETLSSETAMAIQRRLSQYISSLNPKDETGYEMRNVQILVTTKLHSIKNLRQGKDLGTALTGIVRCYKWVYEVAGILHRDISIENLMYRLKDGKIVGVLNDFDLAIYTSQQSNGPISKQRAGTRPFMAIDLLEGVDKPCLHLYRHDLESIMYVIIVLTCYRLASKEVKKTSHIAAWFDPTAMPFAIAASKLRFLYGDLLPVPTKTMQSLSSLVEELYEYFVEMGLAIHADKATRRNKVPLDAETLGGVITMKGFAEIFGIV